MLKSLLSILITQCAISFAAGHNGSHYGMGISSRSFDLLRKKGMGDAEISQLISSMDSFRQTKRDKNHKGERNCGEGLRGLLERVMDKADRDIRQLVTASISNSKMNLFSGNDVVAEFGTKELTIPVETVDDKCFGVSPKFGMPVVLCTGCRKTRNEWINSLHEAILCEKTKVKGKLPLDAGPELEAEAQGAKEDDPKGINLHVADSPLGKPEISINGITIQKMEQAQKKQALAAVQSEESDLENMTLEAENEPKETNNPVNAVNLPKSEAEKQALLESAAEHETISVDDPEVPKNGYEVTKEGHNTNTFEAL